MNDEKLQEIGQEMGVSRGEIGAMKRRNTAERLSMVFEDKAARALMILSGVQGLSIGAFISSMDSAAYPGSYEPPGGMLMPIKAFSGAAGLAGLGGAGYVLKKGGADRRTKLAMVLGTVLFAILAFVAGYCCGLWPFYSMAFMYGAYSNKRREVRKTGFQRTQRAFHRAGNH